MNWVLAPIKFEEHIKGYVKIDKIKNTKIKFGALAQATYRIVLPVTLLP